MDPRVEAVVALIELVRRLGVDHGPSPRELDDHLGAGGDLRGKASEHPGRPAPSSRSPNGRVPRTPAAGGPSAAPDGAARAQEAALRLQSLPGRERDPRRAEWEPGRGGARSAQAGASSLRDRMDKLAKNQCALHEAQKGLQLAVRDVAGKVDVLARSIPAALDAISSTQADLGKHVSALGRQLACMEATLDRFHGRARAEPTPTPRDGGFIFD